MQYFILLIALFLGFPAIASAEYCTFVSIAGLAEQEVGTIVLPEIYKRAGVTLSIVSVPGKRAQGLAASGQVDGEVMRIYSYGSETPSLIRVPTPYDELNTTAFVRKNSGIKINSLEDLKNTGW